MPVSSAESILKRARQMEMARQSATIRVDMSNFESLAKRLDVLEGTVAVLMEKMQFFIETKGELGAIHTRMLAAMNEWRSTAELATVLGYRHEYMSRKVAELKENGLVAERRSGKRIFYKVVPKV